MSTAPGLTMRGQRSDDWESFLVLFNLDEVIRDSLYLPYLSEDAIRDQFGSPPGHVHSLVAEIGLPGGRKRLVGFAWLSVSRNRRRHMAQLNLIVHPDFTGTEAEAGLLQGVLALADDWLNLRRIEIVVYTDQDAAAALYKKHGFEIEATMRHYAFRAGAYHDAYLMARLFSHRGQA